MGVRLLVDRESNQVALYCSTTDHAFGPIISDHRDGADQIRDCEEVAEAFLKWLPRDAREYTDSELALKYADFLAEWDPVSEEAAADAALEAELADMRPGGVLEFKKP